MKVHYDKVADAVYIQLIESELPVATAKPLGNMVYGNYDNEGRLIGIEFADAASQQGMIDAIKEQAESGVPITITEETPSST
jgi:uncharacterized protein YuzE